jgi:class 3 adenylate cyclase
MLYSEMEQKVKERTVELVEKNSELTREKKKSDDLLLNILPAETADELKNYGKTTARRFESVTVLFTDIKDFTRISEILGPEELVSELDHCFKNFDEICMRFGLEKIKTIGDAYMAVGGMPGTNRAKPKDVVNAALAMRDFAIKLAVQRKKDNKTSFEFRLGIHTGPVIAGVVGINKFQYDIWGDTVNIAARMEQHSATGKINISAGTYELVKDEFIFTNRGKVSAKNLGEVGMYFVENAVEAQSI